MIKTTTTTRSTPDESKNGQVVMGDLKYDGRVILYIIKGFSPPHFSSFCLSPPPTTLPSSPHIILYLTRKATPLQRTKHRTSTTSNP